jgi:hypothetical protein
LRNSVESCIDVTPAVRTIVGALELAEAIGLRWRPLILLAGGW